ncbi:MAG: saccharopine dehydrogenase NADP-binding domain-containing protein [Oleibacter sp.]|nr:saccharopine dehydrogenase NADP-binding domain-containing protein [Thalassolituus sp.]
MPKAKFDLVVYGATSFVGSILTRYIATTYGHGKDLRWAIAGRSEEKLAKLRNSLRDVLAQHTSELEIIIADANDDAALSAMCDRARVIVSTVGPYALYGEPLVRACVNGGVDYCDLTGEPQWIKRMLEKYEKQAQISGARIVNCCGFDSIPSDMGVYHLQALAEERLGAPVKHVAMRVKAAKGGMSGGTIGSMMQLTKEAVADPGIRRDLANPYSLCPLPVETTQRQPDLKKAVIDTYTGSWSMPFIMAAINTRIVHRSNALKQYAYGKDFIYEETMLTGKGAKGAAMAWSLTLGLGTFLGLSALAPTRTLMEKYLLPKAGEGPSPKEQEEGFFDIRFFGINKNNVVIKTKVTGDKDPGYGFTGKMLGEAAVCLALDYHNKGKKRWAKGGFWTPGSVFNDVFMERLQTNCNMKFIDLTDKS